jgi:uncharacterized protein
MADFQNLSVNPAELPRTEDQLYHGLSPAYKQVRMLGLLTSGLIILIIALVAVSINGAWDVVWEKPWTLLVGLGVWLLYMGLRFFLLYRGFRRKQYALRERDITYRRGLLQHVATSIPFNRVQHCEVNQSALERIFDTSSLRVYTAGGSSSDLTVPGLSLERSSDLKDYILKQAHEQSPTQD